MGCSPWGRYELGTTERLHFHFSLSCIGEGNGNPLQCSCLENPRDKGAWWAPVYGVTQSRTQLKRLSSSSSSSVTPCGFYFYFLIKKIIEVKLIYHVLVSGVQQSESVIQIDICFCCSVAKSCLTLCDPMDCSPPGSSVRGIFQARVLEWGVIAF